MTSAAALVADLYARGVRLRLEANDRLGYDAPRGVLTSADLDQLRLHKAEILELLGNHAADARAIQPRASTGPAPLSFAQQRLWFLAQLEGPSGTYSMQTVLRLRAESPNDRVDVAAIHAALQDIVVRHEVLRTRLIERHGEPCQVVEPEANVALVVEDFGQLEPDQRAAALAARLRREVETPIDLEQVPLLKALVVAFDPQHHVLAITVHHIASDGWSIGVMLHELSVGYARRVAPNRAATLPALPIQYADYAAWQRRWLSGGRLERQLDFWKRYLADAPPLLRLPSDWPRPHHQTHRGEYLSSSVAAPLKDALTQVGRDSGTTLFPVMLAAYMAILHRHSGQDDLVVGTHIANRTRAETEPLIGFFVNTLALRADFSDRPSFRQLLARLKTVVETAYEYQDLPYEMLVEELRLQRTSAYSPLCQVTFAMQTALSAHLDLPGQQVEVLRREGAAARFDLTLGISESPAGLEIAWRYNTDLFARETIQTLADQFGCLLEHIVQHPTTPIARLALTRTPPPSPPQEPATAPVPILAAIQRWAEQQPAAPAVLDGLADGTAAYSWSALATSIATIGAGLTQLGVGPEVRVAVCLERGPGAVVAALAIWEAGGTYVPIDPEFPASRRQALVEDCRASLLLTTADLAVEVGATTVLLDRHPWPTHVSRRPHPPPPQAAAYLMYTSGSTGTPKGVAVTYSNLAHYLGGLSNAVAIEPSDVYLHTASLGFSSSIRQMVLPLGRGATVVVATSVQRRDPQALAGVIATRGVTVIDLVPSHLASLVAGLPSEGTSLASVRLLLSASEALPPALVERFREVTASRVTVVNMYGQTETTGIAAVLPLDSGPVPGNDSVRIGRAIPGAWIGVLDQDLRPVPPGTLGEIYVGGITVARGYFGSPALTAARFLPDPFSADPGARMYRTGDRGRQAHDGSFEYRSRSDDQTKVRGHRVEPIEVQAALVRHPDVADAAVIIDHHQGEARLLGYAVSSHDPKGSGDPRLAPELLQYLREVLPAYMVPAAVVTLGALPRTASGKLARNALTRPESLLGSGFAPPRDALEHALEQVWCEVLGRQMIGIHEGFFELGGHSLLAVRLLARIEQQLGRRLPLTALFDNQTIATLAMAIREAAPSGEAHGSAPHRDGVVVLRPGSNPVFIVPGGAGSALYLYHLARHLHADQALYGLEPPGLDGVEAPAETVEAVATHCLAAARRIQPHGPYRLAGHSFGGKVALEMAQELLRQGEEVALLAAIDTGPWREQDLSSGDPVQDYVTYLAAMAEFAGTTSTLTLERLSALEGEARLAAIQQELVHIGFLPTGVTLGEVKGLLQVLLASIGAANRYQPSDLLPLPVHLFSAASHGAANHQLQVRRWEAVGPVTLHVIPGTHATMLAEPGVVTLADRLTALVTEGAVSRP